MPVSVARDDQTPPQERAAMEVATAREVTWEILSERINDLVVLADLSGTIFYVSPACRRLGYRQHDMIGRGPADFIHPDDLEHFNANTAAVFAGTVSGPADREHRVRCKDGSWVWLEGSPSVIPDGDGKPMGIINIFRDVTDRRAVRGALAESEQRYRLLAEHVTDMITLTSAAGRFVYLSPSVERLTGFSVAELMPKTMRDFVHPEDLDRCLAFYGELVSGTNAGGQPLRYRIRHKDGRWLWVESKPRLAPSPFEGEPAWIIDVTRDVSEQQALKLKLSEAVEEAERLAKVKSQFLANMSHEIRTPLTAVLGFTSLLAERCDLDPTARAHVHRVAAAGRALLAIVNDVLDFSKLEAGQVTITPRPTAASGVAAEVLEMFEADAAAKGLSLTFVCGPEVPAMVRLDADRLRQVLINLIGNAVKFTDRGEVAVRLSYDAAGARLAVEVADTGPGIAAAQREKLFQRFSQIDGSSTRAKGGTGLGLAISRELAAAMDGAITLRSRVGRGSTFRLELAAPVAEALAAADMGRAEHGDLEGVRVLVVDDNAVNRELARAILEPAGIEVSEASDGVEAVEAARRLPVDVILMDLRMPAMNGREAATVIRRAPGPNQDVPILAFSADTDLAGGLGPFNGMVRKPVSPPALIAAVTAAMSEEPEPMTEELSHAHG